MEGLGEHDLGVAIARREGERPRIEDLTEHARAGAAATGNTLECRSHVGDGDVPFAEPLLECSTDEPGPSHRSEVDERAGVSRHRDRTDHRHVRRREVGDSVLEAPPECDAPMLLHAQLDQSGVEAFDVQEAGGGVVRHRCVRSGGKRRGEEALLMGDRVGAGSVDARMRPIPVA